MGVTVKDLKYVMGEVGIDIAEIEERLLTCNTTTTGKWLSVMLAWHGMSRAELGRQIGCTKQTVCNWAIDRQVPSLGDFVAMWMILSPNGDYSFWQIKNIYNSFANIKKG
jgi:DNA-binding XRE family transcriptional regulator